MIGVPTSARASLGRWLTIIGVISTLYSMSFGSDDHWPPQVLTAFRQDRAPLWASIAVRGPSGVASAATIRRVVASLEPDLPVHGTASTSTVLDDTTWPLRIFGGMFIIFGIVALVLTGIGLYVSFRSFARRASIHWSRFARTDDSTRPARHAHHRYRQQRHDWL